VNYSLFNSVYVVETYLHSLLKHYYTVYDVGGQRIGFAPNGKQVLTRSLLTCRLTTSFLIDRVLVFCPSIDGREESSWRFSIQIGANRQCRPRLAYIGPINDM
jgi:hypothetical protein